MLSNLGRSKSRPDMVPRRPSTAELPAGADQWVRGDDHPAGTPAPPQREATRRLTLDIPAHLHTAMKIRTASTVVTMVDEVTPVLLAHYADDLARRQQH